MELIDYWENYTQAFSAYLGRGNNEQIDAVLRAMVEVTRRAFEEDVILGKEMCDGTLSSIDKAIKLFTNGTFAMLEDYAQQHKTSYSYIDWHYDVLGYAAPNYVDSYKLYIERDRLRKDRFYEPRRRTLIKITREIQKLEND